MQISLPHIRLTVEHRTNKPMFKVEKCTVLKKIFLTAEEQLKKNLAEDTIITV